jgi:hypothetical protein
MVLGAGQSRRTQRADGRVLPKHRKRIEHQYQQRRNKALARVGDIVLIDHPADHNGPRSNNCYFVEVEDAAALGADGKKFKIDAQWLLYSLQWKGTPPDFHLQLVRGPAISLEL